MMYEEWRHENISLRLRGLAENLRQLKQFPPIAKALDEAAAEIDRLRVPYTSYFRTWFKPDGWYAQVGNGIMMGPFKYFAQAMKADPETYVAPTEPVVDPDPDPHVVWGSSDSAETANGR